MTGTGKRTSVFDKARYIFDNTLSGGAAALIGWLAVFSILFVLIIGLLIAAIGLTQAGAGRLGFIEAFWQTLIRMLDPGTFGDDTGWGFRIVMLIVTIGGILVVSILIGIVATAFRNKVDELMRGRSKVLEKNHTLIIRWSPKIITIISELIIANENQKGLSIVVLGNRDRAKMEDEIRAKIPNTGNTKVVCRTGSSLEMTDIEKVNPDEARSIIIISPDAPNPDTHVIKSVLALTNNPNRKKGKYHIVAEIRDEDNIEAAEVVGRDEVTYVLSFDVVAKVTAQTCRQSGLSVIYTELMDYAGDEIYFQEEPALVGKTFKDALFAYEDSAVIGLQYSDKTVAVNPPMDAVIAPGDKIIAITEDDDTAILSGKKDFNIKRGLIAHEKTIRPPTENTLFLGWNEKGPRIIQELDHYSASGSRVMILAEMDGVQKTVDKLNPKLKNQKVEFRYGNITFRSTLDELDIPSFDHIIILSYTGGVEVQEADAQTLICLLHLRNISEQAGRHFSIVSEMLDVRNQALAEVAKADDFIVSDKLISLMLTQLSENKYLKYVFDDFFDAEGSEIYLKPVTDYVKLGEEIDFYTVLESAAQLGEAAFGYRISKNAYDASKGYGIVINPNKSDKIRFSNDDYIIVLAED